jgi:polyhydroxybutyrate depolymerase
MNKNVLFLMACVLLFSLSSFSSEKKTFDHQGLERTYLVHAPDEINQGTSLVVVIHGYTGLAETIMAYSGMNALADKNNFIALYPQGTIDAQENAFFNVGYSFHSSSEVDDVSFIEALVLTLQKEYELNPKNTFATGMSNGGDMSYLLACKKSDLFAAVAPIAGVMMKSTLESCKPSRNIPLFQINGTQDEISLFEGDIDDNEGWGPYYDTPSTLAFWVKQHELNQKQSIPLEDKDPSDGSSIIFERYFSKDNQKEMWFYKIEGGGHTWPGWKAGISWWKNPLLWYYLPLGNNDINASEEVWSFFERYVEQ